MKWKQHCLDAGWEWVKDDPYDQAYYRDHMHELPPLIHATRDRMIDVHHTILPLTAEAEAGCGGDDIAEAVASAAAAAIFADPYDDWPGEPDPEANGEAGARIEDARPPMTVVLHCAAHMLADGELDGGLRNLWDFHCLTKEMERRTNGKFWKQSCRGGQGHTGYIRRWSARPGWRIICSTPKASRSIRAKLFWRSPDPRPTACSWRDCWHAMIGDGRRGADPAFRLLRPLASAAYAAAEC